LGWIINMNAVAAIGNSPNERRVHNDDSHIVVD
jgi:hypothetical protein